MVSKDTCRSRRETERACSYLKNLKRRQLPIKMLVGTIEGGGLRTSLVSIERILRETTEGAPFLIVAIINGSKGVYH